MNRTNAISEDTQFRVLRLIEENPHASQREIAAALGLSLGGVNYCLRALVGKGLLKIENFRKSGNKLGYLYLLTPEGIAEKTHLTESFLRRKIAEYQALREEINAVRSSPKVQLKSPTAAKCCYSPKISPPKFL